MSVTLYHCDSCNMNFTAGSTAEYVNLLTGEPVENMEEGKDFGEGFCPNCTKQGEEIGEHESVVGDDAPPEQEEDV